MKFLKQYVAYVKDNPEGYWFKRKLFGWGWVPARPQGWLVILLYLFVMLSFASSVTPHSSDREVLLMVVLPFLLLTTTLIRICYKKGERPKWMWGMPEKYKKEERKS